MLLDSAIALTSTQPRTTNRGMETSIKQLAFFTACHPVDASRVSF